MRQMGALVHETVFNTVGAFPEGTFELTTDVQALKMDGVAVEAKVGSTAVDINSGVLSQKITGKSTADVACDAMVEVMVDFAWTAKWADNEQTGNRQTPAIAVVTCPEPAVELVAEEKAASKSATSQ
jgi:hypothetical protein